MPGDSPVVVLYDATGKALAVRDGVAVPADTPGLIPLTKAADGTARYLQSVLDGTVYRMTVDSKSVIRGATSGHEAEVTSTNRLRVDTRASAPLGSVQEYLKDTGGSPDMDVNGSVTPVVFSYYAGSDYDVELSSITMIIEEPAIAFGTTFWGETGLTNGLLVEVKSEDLENVLCNPRYTRECLEAAEVGGFDLVTATPDFARVVRAFPPGTILKKAGTYPGDEDYIRATVRDNISGLSYFRMIVRGTKVV